MIENSNCFVLLIKINQSINLCSRDLQRATTILEMVRRREETKRDHLKMTVNIFEKRVEIRDFNGAVYSELNAQYKNSRCVSNLSANANSKF